MPNERIKISKTSSLYSLSTNIEDNDIDSFNENDYKYLCCCGLLHSTTGVKIITLLLDIALLFLLVRIVINIIEGSSRNEELSLIFRCLIICPHALTMTLAIWKENSSFMIPFITLQIVGLFIGCFQVAALLYIIIIENDVLEDVTILYHICTYIIIIILQLWFTLIVISCWRYYCDKRYYGAKSAYPHFVLIKPVKKQINNDNNGNETNCYELQTVNNNTCTKNEIYDSDIFI